MKSRHRLPWALSLTLLLIPHIGWAGSEEDSKAEQASEVLRALSAIPEEGIPQSLLDGSDGIAVIPGVIKAGFVIGGRHGKGVLAVKENGTWSNPTYISLSGGSFGFQAGVQSTDVVLVFKTRRSVDGIVKGKFTLGGDASVAAGPIGRSAQAATDAELKAEIYSYSRSRGLFAGVALDGSVIQIDHDANEAAYGGGITPRAILAGRVDNVPAAIVAFRDALEEVSAL